MAPSLYEHSGNILLRFILLILLEKICFYSEAKLIQHLFQTTPITTFLVSLLSEKDIMTITMSLLIFDALVDKLNSMETLLIREGVLEMMEAIAKDNAWKNLEVYST